MKPPASLVGLVANARRRFPGETALEDGAARYDYTEVSSRALVLSQALQQAGVGAEHVVALETEPGLETVVAMLAAGLRGAAFLPIDPREPDARRESMLESARPRAVVSHGRVHTVPDAVRLDRRLPPQAGPAAYVSFTSSSTGAPKAVVTEQFAILNYVEQVVAAYDLRLGDRQLQFSSIGFDIAIDEIFSTLAAGATLVQRGGDFVFGGVAEFLLRCHERQITVLNLPTGLWNRLGAGLASDPGVRLPAELRLVVVGGESARRSAVTAWHAAATHPDFRVLNAYGPTEAAVSVTLAELRPDVPVTIGRPLAGVGIRLLDRQGAEVADGQPGEIVVSGAAVARGYLDQAESGFGMIAGEWSYRTGDVARRVPSDELEFLGRMDAQVKVRGGFRVEPGEVAEALLSHPSVRQAHVQVHEHNGTNVLAAFVVPTAGRAVGVSELRAVAAAALPDWMVPWHIEIVEVIPLTDRGKVDAVALAGLIPAADDSPTTYDVRHGVLRAWETALGALPQSDDESFFEAGGDSLAALEFVEIIAATLGSALPMRELYRAPTVGEVVALLSSRVLDPDLPTAHHTTGRALVRMRRAGAGRLWCFLPPLSGAVTRYAAMAAQLPVDDAVWAMETPAALSDAGMESLTDGLAERLMTQDLSGFTSIVFSGYSLGGVFAHEVAHRIEAALADGPGTPPVVASLLLDPPDPAEPQLSLDEAFDIFVRVGWRIGEPLSDFVTTDGYDLAGVAAAARRAGSLPPSSADTEVSDAWHVYASNARILDDYVIPEGVARTRLLQCCEHAEIPAGEWRPGRPSGSWAHVVRPGHTSIVAAEHFALMEAPHDRTVLGWLIAGAEAAEAM